MTRWTTHPDYLAGLQATVTTGAPATDPPDSVVTWLAKLRLLYGVPFFYLVPDARMLPPESIRFFQVDENWLDALLDGAFSIGRSTTGDAEREANRTAQAKTAAVSASTTHRARTRAQAAQATAWIQAAVAARDAARQAAGEAAAPAAGVASDSSSSDTSSAAPSGGTETDAAGTAPAPAPATADTGDSGDGGDGGDGDDSDILTETPVTGFILRSAVVSGWPGMEVRAYQDAAMTQPADVLRLDRVADDILFGLFGQQVAALQFSEPAETLHFGFEIPEHEGDPYVKILKYVNAPGHAPGSEITGATVAAAFRDGGRRVVDVLSLQDALHSALIAKGGITNDGAWTAAEFALEMVQGVEEVNYIVEGS